MFQEDIDTGTLSDVTFEATALTTLGRDLRHLYAGEVKKLFKIHGWTRLDPERWGALTNPATTQHDVLLPWTLVGRMDGKVVASASLVERDHPTMKCGPWLSGLVVHPNYKRRKLGKFLIHDIELHAAALYHDGHPALRKGKIYLCTERTINLDFDSVAMYSRLGWQFNTPEDAHKQEDIVMWKSVKS